MPSLTTRGSYEAARKVFCLQKKETIWRSWGTSPPKADPIGQVCTQRPLSCPSLDSAKAPDLVSIQITGLVDIPARRAAHPPQPGAKHRWLGGWNDSLWQLWIYQTQKSSLRKFLKTSDIWLSPHRGNIPFEDIWGFNTVLTIISRMVNVFKGMPHSNYLFRISSKFSPANYKYTNKSLCSLSSLKPNPSVTFSLQNLGIVISIF